MCAPLKGKGRLAQLVRASRLHREGQRFESVNAHHFKGWNICSSPFFMSTP